MKAGPFLLILQGLFQYSELKHNHDEEKKEKNPEKIELAPFHHSGLDCDSGIDAHSIVFIGAPKRYKRPTSVTISLIHT